MDERTRRQITWVIIGGIILIFAVLIGTRRTEMARMTHAIATGKPHERIAAVERLIARQKLPEALLDQPRWVQDNAVTAATMIGSNQAMSQLIASVYVLDAPVAARVNSYLVTQDVRAIGPLVAALQDKDANTRAGAPAPLTKIGAAAIPSLLPLIDAYDDYVRDNCVTVLSGIGAPAAAPMIRVLKRTEPGEEEKAAAFLRGRDTAQRTLQAMKVPAIEPILNQLLTHTKSELRGLACTMLGAIIDQALAPPVPAEEANKTIGPLLARLQTDSEWAVRRKAATALGMLGKLGRGNAAVVSALEGRLSLSTEAQAEVRAAAATALGRLEAVQSAGALVSALIGPSRAGATQEIATALQRLGPKAIPALGPALRAADGEVRRAATETLAEIGTRAAAGPLAAQLSDPDPVIRRIAARALVDAATPAVVPALIRALDDSDWQVYHAAREALGNVGAPAAGQLVAMLGVDNPRVNYMVSEALQRIGPASVAPLTAMLRSANPHARQWAAITLGAIGGDVVGAVSAVLTDGGAAPSARAAAATALGATRAQAAVGPLLAVADAPQPELRAAALRALANVGAEEATEALVAGLTAPSAIVRDAAMEALRTWQRGNVGDLLQQVAAGQDADAKLRAAIVLAFQSSPDALGPLSQVLGSAHEPSSASLSGLQPTLEAAVGSAGLAPSLRRQAIASLGYLGSEQSLAVLQPFLRQGDPFLAAAADAVALIGKTTYATQAQAAAVSAGGRPAVPASSQAAQMLMDAFLTLTTDSARLTVARALGSTGAAAAEVVAGGLKAAPAALRPWVAAICGAVGKPANDAVNRVRLESLKSGDKDMVAWATAAMWLIGDSQTRDMLSNLPPEEQGDPAATKAAQKLLDQIRASQ